MSTHLLTTLLTHPTIHSLIQSHSLIVRLLKYTQLI